MSTLLLGREQALSVSIPFDSIRNITSPEDRSAGRMIYAGQIPAEAVLLLPTDENVRAYLVDAEGKQRRAKTQVHRAIRSTLDEDPRDFAFLNGGVVIVARSSEIDEKSKKLILAGPSIINGSQTQGVLREYFEDYKKDGTEPSSVFVTFQLLVTDDDNLIAEVSIARNYQNDVKPLSIVGRRGHLKELQTWFQKTHKDKKLRMSETDFLGEPTEKLIQVCTALIPEELWAYLKPKEKGVPNKVYTYSMKAKCLKDFDDIYIKATESKDPEERRKAKELYDFYLHICGEAWLLYKRWKEHQGFKGTGIKNAVTRAEDGRTIKEVQEGMVFPIIAALSAFCEKVDGVWTIRPPMFFDEKDLIDAAISAYQEIAGSNPWNMGKSKACYTSCYRITSMAQKYGREAAQ